jgi:aspartate/methionine/tyrosine aminotransferase
MFSRRTGWNLNTNRYTEALAQHRSSGRELLDLTVSNPTTIGLSYHGNELLGSLGQPRVLRYDPVAKGLRIARDAVAGYYAEKGSVVDPDDLVLTTSTSEGYSFVFRLLCDAGDAVLVPAPSYPLFDFLADLNDVKLVPYELVYDHGWQLDVPSLHSAIDRSEAAGHRSRAVLVVHPNNPTGSFTKAHELAALNELCRRHKLAAIADEVFLDYPLTANKPLTFVANQEVLTFTLSGLSKISALPQMKVAWLAVSGPAQIKAEALARLEVIADTYLSMNAPVQLALQTMLAERSNVQPQLLELVRRNLALLDSQLAASRFCQRLAIEGGWYAVLRVPALQSDEELAVSLLQSSGVLLQPGHFYNFASDGYLVISLITPAADFELGIPRTLAYLERTSEDKPPLGR